MSQADVNKQMERWGDRQIARFRFRVELFKRRRVEPELAEAWADRLALRDQERDGRRLCIECKHRQDDRGCFAAKQGRIPGADKRLATLDFQLQRCSAFDWVTP